MTPEKEGLFTGDRPSVTREVVRSGGIISNLKRQSEPSEPNQRGSALKKHKQNSHLFFYAHLDEIIDTCIFRGWRHPVGKL